MGTSLSGLTPATTFDGLLKTSDNDALGTGLKTIGTGDGTDSVLQLSNSQLNVAGQFTVDTDTTATTMNLRGDGLNINQVYQANNTTYNTISMINSAGIQFKNLANTVAVIRSDKFGLGIGGSTTPSATAHIKGSGATSATTSLLVQNSAGSELLKVTDDGAIDFSALGLEFSNDGSGGTMSVASDRYIKLASSLSTYSALNAHIFKTFGSGGYSEVMRITGNTNQLVGIGETTPTARLHVKGSGNTNTTTSLLVQNSDGLDAFKIDDSRAIDATSTAFRVRKASNNSQALFVGETYTASAQKTIINSLQGPNAIFQVVGSGATSATTALLVQNSAGDDKFKVRDDGIIFFGRSDAYMLGGNSFGGNWYFTGDSIFRGVLRNDSGSVKVNDDLNVGGNADNDTGVRLQVKGSGNTATTTALLVQNSDAAELLKVTDDGNISASGSRLTIGDGTSTSLRLLANTNNNYIQPLGTPALQRVVVTGNSVATIKAVDLDASNVYIGYGINQTAATGTLSIKGSGATSATTALLVQNSAGTELLKVDDSGASVFSGLTTFNNNVTLKGANTTSSLNNLRFVVPGSAKSLTINKDYSFTNDASAIVDIQSTTQGFLPPRMTTTQRDAITTPAAGLMIYNTDTNTAECWNGTAWMPMF